MTIIDDLSFKDDLYTQRIILNNLKNEDGYIKSFDCDLMIVDNIISNGFAPVAIQYRKMTEDEIIFFNTMDEALKYHKMIKVTKFVDFTHGSKTRLIEYKYNDKIGYEFINNPYITLSNIELGLYEHEGEDIDRLVMKKSFDLCSWYLKEIITKCIKSDCKMLFITYDDELFNCLCDEYANFKLNLIKEVDKLGIGKYIKFDKDDCAITIYGGVITQFLF